MVDELAVALEASVDAKLVLNGDKRDIGVVDSMRGVSPTGGILLVYPPSNLPRIAVQRAFVVNCGDARLSPLPISS